MATTTGSKGWAWILRNDGRPARENTKFGADFDGAYQASCPRCGQDSVWNAYSFESLCTCDGTP